MTLTSNTCQYEMANIPCKMPRQREVKQANSENCGPLRSNKFDLEETDRWTFAKRTRVDEEVISIYAKV